ncbi:mevalonate kinase family protein [Wenzhouxiangella sp. EGI_FJ10305]|uniref:mevalonate kinase family protein n=1 Tax=Wenzhouxiangella sp. EGI_FJ10305 TaxID=3243768 RepID=UPI0035DA9267
MPRWVATAPGKIVLLGEYAVLEGAPALVQAVDRRCRVELVHCQDADCRIEAPQLGIPPVRFRVDDRARLNWQEAVPAPFARTAALIESVLGYIAECGGRPGPFRMRVDTAELFDGSGQDAVKLGLGSSAATAVAIDAVLRAAFLEGGRKETDFEIVSRLLQPGRKAQGNAGSGIDLAASLCGGLLGYRIRDERIEIRPLSLPGEIKTCFVWAGEPASTAELLTAWRRSREQHPREHGRLLGEMQTVASAGLEAVERGDVQEILACWSDYGEIMGKMNDLVGCEIVTAEHRIAGGLAELLNGVYKPCGAGGGDLGMAASLDSRFRSRMRHLCRQAGLKTLPLRPSEQGVRVTTE